MIALLKIIIIVEHKKYYETHTCNNIIIKQNGLITRKLFVNFVLITNKWECIYKREITYLKTITKQEYFLIEKNMKERIRTERVKNGKEYETMRAMTKRNK